MNIFEIPRNVEKIITRLEAAGFETWLVGGCVRDILLSRKVNDWDIATSAKPENVIGIFEKTVPTGIKYGTVTVILDGSKAEVTTFRSESSYEDCRRPSNVIFGEDISADLSRRDFTINAMAYHPERGIFDPFCGQDDLENRLVRAVGEPDERFREDALRILRAFRFAAQLGFDVELLTLKAADRNAVLVEKVSCERIKSELERILLSERPSEATKLVDCGALDFLGLIPTLHTEILPKIPNVSAVRWAAFLYLCTPSPHDPNGTILDRLRFDSRTRSVTLWLMAELEREQPLPIDAAGIKRRLSSGVLPEIYAKYLKLYHVLNGCDTTHILKTLDTVIKSGEPYSVRMLAVNGSDIVSAGIGKGEECGRILKLLLEKTIENPALNSKNVLLQLAKEFKNGMNHF